LHYRFAARLGSVTILGKTNVNSFKCVNTQLQEIKIPNEPSSGLPNFQMKTADFNCGGKMMTQDFRKTLLADKFPSMTVRFLKAVKTGTNKYLGTFEVKITGRTRIYETELMEVKNLLNGQKTVKFSDFNLVPPKKMGGMIVVNDVLNLSFSLNK